MDGEELKALPRPKPTVRRAQLEATVDPLNVKVDPMIKKLLKTGPKPNANSSKSFVTVASAALSGSKEV
ncbi:hypothetical protein PTTG_28106 [Puccinia triticina 1-1 BBBD Race 1]|uniref:Uncharacterized protein n=1 Tax=Puccinia triticina (isolate 1-1 / race 1 (BBBD)) TaxID=630390 RepID=A0A180GEK5_PUCT1|nr:hypothetical protein PTTG_28106 [Puccinia triticina 1-1 BBBD Race 1]